MGHNQHGPRGAPTGWLAAGAIIAGAAAWAAGCSGDDPAGPPPSPPPPTAAVASTSPSAHFVGAPRGGDLVVAFDRPVRATSQAGVDVRLFARWSGSIATELSWDDERTLRIRPERAFSAGERVAATLVAGSYEGVEGERGPGYSWSFRVASGPGVLAQSAVDTIPVRRPGEPHIQTYGAYAGDLNGDGWSDLVLPNEQSADLRIFLNDGAGGYSDFSIVAVPDGVDPSTNAGGDIDGDGDIDLVVGNARGQLAAVFVGDGMGGLRHVQNLTVGLGVRGVCLLDFDNDGDPDLVATAWIDDELVLFTNSGGRFTRSGVVDVGGGVWSCATGDLDADGFIDLFIGTRGTNEIVGLISNGTGWFTERGRVAAGDAWMLASGDFDGDGRVDAAAVNGGEASLAVARGGFGGTPEMPAVYPLAGFPLAIDAGDIDGDGDLDIVTSDFETGAFLLWENDGGAFRRLPEFLSASTAASCAILHDRDNDGDLDITGIDEIDDLLFLYENGAE